MAAAAAKEEEKVTRQFSPSPPNQTDVPKVQDLATWHPFFLALGFSQFYTNKSVK